MAYQLFYVLHAEEINTGKRSPEELGVRALDDFTFQVDLQSPTPFFLHLITQYIFNAVPRHAIEEARQAGNESSWTQPGRMVSSGAFLLKEWRRYERIVAVRNPLYYDAGMVEIDELHFAPVVDGSAMVESIQVGRWWRRSPAWDFLRCSYQCSGASGISIPSRLRFDLSGDQR